ncbi:MAG: transcriptional repressor LexA [Dehalococcoidales bacterium]|nr:transcriptional repressor LexA [Dehalococcoidales bacterium]
MILKTKELSDKQRRIVEFIRGFWSENNFPPSVRDIVAGCGLSSTSVADYNLKILEKKGIIRRHKEVSRGIELPPLSRQPNSLNVPVIGLIAAGQPIPVPDNDTWDISANAETIEVTRDIIRGSEGIYALKVKGNSMIEDLINDGDIVLLQSVNVVENGETAAVWLKSEKEATLKKFYLEASGKIRLQPANSQMQAIYASPDNVEVQGRVIAVIRRMG